MAATPRPGVELAGPLSDPEFYAGDPFPLYARLRREAPVAWNDDLGFWALSRHAEVQAVSRQAELFCSSQGILLGDIGRDLPETPGALLYVDPPEHTRYRRLVQPAFAPSRVRALEGPMRQRVRALLDEVPLDEPVDIVDALALPYPLAVIADLLGLPADRWRTYGRWSDAAIEAGTAPTDENMALLGDMAAELSEVIAAKRDDPADDLISTLVTVSVADPDTGEEEQLTDDELMMFCVQLLVAGNDTTRNLVAGGLVALAEHPAEWQRVLETVDDVEAVGVAVEELLRWTTPVISFLRTATRATEVGGQPIAAGEHLLLLYSSANRDEAVFGPTAGSLDVRRQPNPHLAFGFGHHHCLGAALARMEARVLLEELAPRVRALESAGPVHRLATAGVVAGVLEAPLVLHRAGST
ncbi:MAG: cytochrome P450 [Acidimicrobiia bacterium]|nr:cytochrome P450 [Acidimicrobiia bacterium]